MNRQLLKKYIENTCTAEELESILEWFMLNGESEESKALLWDVWQKLPEDDVMRPSYRKLLDTLHYQLNHINPGNNSARIERNFFEPKLNHVFSKVAAILLFPVIGILIFISYKYHNNRHELLAANNSYNEVYSSVDAITKVLLPDGTAVWLNHNSMLKYPSVFGDKFRTVELSGEGYFEVVSDNGIPFVVKTWEIRVVAKGTTFNILAYPGEERIETSLLKGRVELEKNEEDNSAVSLAIMEPSEMIIFDRKSKELISSEITDERNYSWKDGKLIFKKEPLVNVVDKLERWFNVDFEIKDQRLYELSLNATFMNENLSQVLELISLAVPVEYSVSNREILGDGTYSKRKVTLSYKGKK